MCWSISRTCSPRTLAYCRPGRYDEVIARLVKLKAARPATLKKLGSSMLSWFKPPLSQAEVDALLAQLAKSRKIAIDGTKVSYAL